MKVIKVNYMQGEARFVIDEFSKKTFCITLKGKKTLQEIKDALKLTVPSADESQEIFNSLNIKSIEGTDI